MGTPFEYLRPTTPHEAVAMKARHGVRARFWAGGTDLMLGWQQGTAAFDYCIDLGFLSGLDGIDRALDPPAPADTPYETDADPLPRSLMDALQALSDSSMFRAALGDQFIDYILTLKQAEVSRFLSTVTDWEHREYFEMF